MRLVLTLETPIRMGLFLFLKKTCAVSEDGDVQSKRLKSLIPRRGREVGEEQEVAPFFNVNLSPR